MQFVCLELPAEIKRAIVSFSVSDPSGDEDRRIETERYVSRRWFDNAHLSSDYFERNCIEKMHDERKFSVKYLTVATVCLSG